MAAPQQPLQAPPEAGSMSAAHRELLARTPDVIAPGHTFGSVTDKISGIILTRRTPIGWFLGIGIGHAGTLISAILLLFRQQWRTSINRFAEAMTLFAVACAAMFPLLHTG